MLTHSLFKEKKICTDSLVLTLERVLAGHGWAEGWRPGVEVEVEEKKSRGGCQA